MEFFGSGPGDRDSIPGRVMPKPQKWHLMLLCLTFIIIKYRSRLNWINPKNGVVSSSKPRCSSIKKRSLQIALDSGHRHSFYCNDNERVPHTLKSSETVVTRLDAVYRHIKKTLFGEIGLSSLPGIQSAFSSSRWLFAIILKFDRRLTLGKIDGNLVDFNIKIESHNILVAVSEDP